VLFCDVDELVFADPTAYSGGLTEFRDRERMKDTSAAVLSFGVIHRPEFEPPINFALPILQQRRWWHRWPVVDPYDKPLLVHKAPMFGIGFHMSIPQPAQNEFLLMAHLKLLDYDWYLQRNAALRKHKFSKGSHGDGQFQEEHSKKEFTVIPDEDLMLIPDAFRRPDLC
jgi:hypothetical protein